jgi:hypothetical protein
VPELTRQIFRSEATAAWAEPMQEDTFGSPHPLYPGTATVSVVRASTVHPFRPARGNLLLL